MLLNASSNKMNANVIEPNQCIIEDFQVLSFENEDQLNLYTLWHEALYDKRRELNAESERERQIIRNEIARKTGQLVGASSEVSPKVASPRTLPSKSSNKKRSSKSSKLSSRRKSDSDGSVASSSARKVLAGSQASKASSSSPFASPSRRLLLTTEAAFGSPNSGSLENSVPIASKNVLTGRSIAANRKFQGSASLPNGLAVMNSIDLTKVPNVGGKQVMKYRLTKIYNKYRGRQMRRNFVHTKQLNTKIENEVSKSYLNSWLAYTALQALKLPDSNNMSALSATTTSAGQIYQIQANPVIAQSAPPTGKKTKSPKKNQHQTGAAMSTAIANGTGGNAIAGTPATAGFVPLVPPAQPTMAPMHLVYIDPKDLITYSNRINPQQVAAYRRKSHLLPSSATSKKSSAASYDVYEIMEVLANSNKTNVSITRNIHRPNSQQSAGSTQTGSIYSHSVNSSTPGIVSTQLHLQARSYLDSMRKFYAEEAQRLEKEREEMNNEPSIEDVISQYIYTTPRDCHMNGLGCDDNTESINGIEITGQ